MNLRTARIILIVLLALEVVLLVLGPQVKDHLPQIEAALAKQEKQNWWDDAAMGVHYAAWVNVGLLVALIATSKFWALAFQPSAISHQPSAISHPKWFWPSLIGAAVLCLGLRLPLASKSLWWDEAWAIKEASHGKWTPDKKREGEMKFTAHDWKRCAWYYQKPTNHAPMSLLQKLSIGAWQKLTGANRTEFSDLAARVPALIASCLAVVLLGCLLRAWGRPGGGVCAAFLLAIHPWHIRYGVDARAYALVVPLCISGMFAVTRIFETRGVRIFPFGWWGLTEFVWLWAYPNAVFDVAALNIVAAVLLWSQHKEDRPNRQTALLRLAVTSLFAAMCFIQVFLPNLMQARRWAGLETDAHVLDLSNASVTISSLLFGHPFWFNNYLRGEMLQDAGSMGINDFQHRISFLLFFTWVILLSVIFLRRSPILRQFPPATQVMGGLILAALLFSGAVWTAHFYFYPRFLIALLPVLIAAVALVLTESRWPKFVFCVTIAAIAANFILPIRSLLNIPIEPLHDVAAFVQHESGKGDKAPLVVCYGLGREVMPVYLPECMPVEDHAGLQQVMQRAADENRPLYAIFGYEGFNRARSPGGFELLDNPARFEKLADFPGIEQAFSFQVLRGKGTSWRATK